MVTNTERRWGGRHKALVPHRPRRPRGGGRARGWGRGCWMCERGREGPCLCVRGWRGLPCQSRTFPQALNKWPSPVRRKTQAARAGCHSLHAGPRPRPSVRRCTTLLALCRPCHKRLCCFHMACCHPPRVCCVPTPTLHCGVRYLGCSLSAALSLFWSRNRCCMPACASHGSGAAHTPASTPGRRRTGAIRNPSYHQTDGLNSGGGGNLPLQVAHSRTLACVLATHPIEASIYKRLPFFSYERASPIPRAGLM